MGERVRSDLEAPRNEGEQNIEHALAPFGWTCGPEFWERYYSDPWVFNLANAVTALTRKVEQGV